MTDYDFFNHHDPIKGISADEELWTQIIEDIDTLLTDRDIAYFTAKDVATAYNKKSVSRCITKLCECENYPHSGLY